MINKPGMSDVHVDAPLTSMSIMYKNAGYVGEKLLPLVNVKQQTDLYWIYTKKYWFKVRDDLRAPGSAARELFFDLETSNYRCEGHALRKPIADEIIANQDDPLDMEASTTEIITDAIMLNREQRIATLLTNTANYAAGHNASPVVKWNTYATADPRSDILTAVRTIHSKIFRYPNIIMIPFEVAVHLSQTTQIVDMVRYIGNDQFKLLKVEQGILIPKNLWGMEVVIAEAGYNTANIGQAETLAYVWGENVIIAYVKSKPKLQDLTLGCTFNWKNRRTRKWYDKAIQATYVECEEWTDEVVVANDCGYILTNTLA